MEKTEKEIDVREIEQLLEEAKDSGYEVVSILSDGSIGHYFDINTTEMDGTVSLVTVERTDVLREFESRSVSWKHFVHEFAQKIYDELNR